MMIVHGLELPVYQSDDNEQNSKGAYQPDGIERHTERNCLIKANAGRSKGRQVLLIKEMRLLHQVPFLLLIIKFISH